MVHSPIETLFHVSFGQFLDHDVVLTPGATNTDANGHPVDIECGDGCSTTGDENVECFPIEFPSDESFFVDSECLTFVRSEAGVNDDCTNSKGPLYSRVYDHVHVGFRFNNFQKLLSN